MAVKDSARKEHITSIHWPEKVTCPSLMSVGTGYFSQKGRQRVSRVSKYIGNNTRVFDFSLSSRLICNLSEHPVGSVFKIHPEYHFFTTFTATSLFHYITICLEYCSSPRLAFVLLPLSPYCLFLTQHMDNSAKKDSNHVILQLKTL